MQPAKIAPKDRLIVALDLPGVEAAEAMIVRLGDSVTFYKIGYQLCRRPAAGASARGRRQEGFHRSQAA
jgi:orotidine-5'-phosphate decarboxylase